MNKSNTRGDVHLLVLRPVLKSASSKLLLAVFESLRVLARLRRWALLLAMGLLPVFTTVHADPVEKSPALNNPRLERVVSSAHKLPRVHSLTVAHQGKVVVEHVFAGPPLDEAVNIKSMSKTVISALVGIAIEREFIKGADQPIVALLKGGCPRRQRPVSRRLR